jgi:hypothetical protein
MMNAYNMLRPSLEDERRFRCVTVENGIAVVILAPLEEIAHDELQLAIRLHASLGRGLLVVV